MTWSLTAVEPVCSVNLIVPEINRARLLQQIINHLEDSLKLNINAAEQAHETATNSENAAENRYDTLGLEAAYLAQGQSQRVVAGEVDIVSFKALRDLPHSESIAMGSLVALAEEGADEGSLIWISECAFRN